MSTPSHAHDSQRSNAAVYYHPDGYVTHRGKLMGRHAAGEGFLQGFARHARVETLFAFANSREHYESFCRQIKTLSGGKALEWLPANRPERLSQPGALYLPGPDLTTHAWLRRGRDPSAYCLTGVTHTICTHRVMDSLAELLLAPVEEWDALICTSNAVKRGVEAILGGYGEYLAERLGVAGARTPAQLPVIPLGVDCDRLAGGADADSARKQLRERYGIVADDVCVLFFGRLSYHAKAHPMPMFQALEAAAQETGRRLHLILAGWYATDGIQRAFEQGAMELCPSVRIIYADGRQAEIRNQIWRAADIFCSLSDNVQETFGLTPVEAMAAGLPVVASDWNGYQGTVEDGVTGVLVPTIMPSPGSGEELAYRHFCGEDNYDQFLGNVCQSVVVDSEAAKRAFVALIPNADLRRRMGEAGRARARRLFDWSVIIAAYQDLWAELNARRRAADRSGAKRPGTVPLRADPYRVFRHYATRTLDEETWVELSDPDPVRAFRRLNRLKMNRMGRNLFPKDDEIEKIIDNLRVQGSARLKELLKGQQDDRRTELTRTVGWLAKMGIVKLAG